MAHGPRYTQMAHGGFKSDDRGTWVGLPLETTFFCLIPSHSFHRKRSFFEGFSKSNLNKNLANTILNRTFVKSVRFLGNFLWLSSRMCHLIVPKICGTQDSQKKIVFSKGFQQQFKQRLVGNHNPESSFDKSARILMICHCYRPECAI